MGRERERERERPLNLISFFLFLLWPQVLTNHKQPPWTTNYQPHLIAETTCSWQKYISARAQAKSQSTTEDRLKQHHIPYLGLKQRHILIIFLFCLLLLLLNIYLFVCLFVYILLAILFIYISNAIPFLSFPSGNPLLHPLPLLLWGCSPIHPPTPTSPPRHLTCQTFTGPSEVLESFK